MRSQRSRDTLDRLITPILIVTGLALFLPHLNFAPTPFFDEYRYIPAARQFLSGMSDENWSHPPLGKILISLGIWLFGDKPLGWRFMSALFGAFTLVGMYHWGLALFRKRSLAIEVAALCLLNQLLFGQSRIAMLDGFMFTFIAFGMAAFTRHWMSSGTPLPGKPLIVDAGLSFGLALATKWFGFVPVIFCAGLLLVSDWRKTGLHKVTHAITLIGISLATYAVVLLLALGGRAPSNFVALQDSMYTAQTQFKAPHHPYRDSWVSWPLMLKPIWYGYLTQPVPGNDWDQGVLFVGNPGILWGGLLAVILCAVLAIRKRSKAATLVAGSYLAFWLSWALIPRNTVFFFYYFPAAMVLSLAIALALHELKTPKWAKGTVYAVFALIFIYFFPIISGQVMHERDFQQRLWLPGWRVTSSF